MLFNFNLLSQTYCRTPSVCYTHSYSRDYDNDNDNDNDNILFDHNLQIEITIYSSLENQIINKLVWRLL